MEQLKPYPAYKDSGVPWLGRMPAHWTLSPGRSVLHEKKVRNTGMVESQVLSLSYGRIVVKPSEKLHGLVPESFETYQVVDPGDIIIRSTDLQNDWNSLRTGLVKNRGIITSAYLCLNVNGTLVPEYAHLLLHTYDLKKIFYGMGSGLRQNLDFRDFKYLPLLAPPREEQQTIARFLDHIDRRINRYIRAKRRLIALLNEQKQAIIHRAVTRGLDPDVPLKPSGVEWLGEIPEHWEVRRVKQVSTLFRGRFSHRPRNDPELYEGPYPFIQTGDVARATKSIVSYKQTLNERGLTVSKMFPAGTLVMTIAANIGDVAVLDFEACFPDSIVGFYPKDSIDRDFLYYVFRAMKQELLREAPVNTQGNLNVDRIGSRSVAFTSLNEQQEIVRCIEQSINGFNEAIERAKREIALIREYRTRLIADVVTGKLDVRGVALPEDGEAGEAELFDEMLDKEGLDAEGEEDGAWEEAEDGDE